MTNPTKLDLLKTAILVEWIKGDRNAPHFVGSFFFGHYDEEGIAQSEDFASLEEIEEALRSLESEQLVTGYHHDLANSRWFLNEDAALKFHTKHIHDPKNLLHQVERLGRGWVVEILENIQNTERKTSDPKRKPSLGAVKSYPTVDDVPNFDSLADVDNLSEVERLSDIGVPASDRIVEIDHNAQETTETILTLRAVVDEARKSNEFAELFADPDEKVIVLSEMEAGIGLLSGSKVYIETIKSLLVSKLEWIKEKLPEWSASALVSKGLDLLLKLLGLG